MAFVAQRVPARIHVLLASRSPVGVVIRRGPAKHVATLLWDRRNDAFQLGQWLKGRIYELRCDLSPDGKHLIYFVGQWNRRDSAAGNTWTAISRTPYLKAVALFPQFGTWYGGGIWTGDNSYWLHPPGDPDDALINTSLLRHDRQFEPPMPCGFGDGTYCNRLLRDGWTIVGQVEELPPPLKYTFQKTLPNGWALRKTPRAPHWDLHQLVPSSASAVIERPDWEWADRDGERLVWATKGKIFAGDVGEEGLTNPKELFDFNDMTFERIEAPY